MKPDRIQLKRTKGWKMPPDTVKVDRTTQWGNPFRIGDPGVPDAETAVALFRAAILLCDHLQTSRGLPSLADVLVQEFGWVPYPRHIAALRGKNLACWCKPGQPCHADVLLEIANA